MSTDTHMRQDNDREETSRKTKHPCHTMHLCISVAAMSKLHPDRQIGQIICVCWCGRGISAAECRTQRHMEIQRGVERDGEAYRVRVSIDMTDGWVRTSGE